MSTLRETFAVQADRLAQDFARLQKLPPEYAARLETILQQAPTLALELILEHRVKFAWPLAEKILQDRKVPVQGVSS